MTTLSEKSKYGRALGELLSDVSLPTRDLIGVDRRHRLRVSWSMSELFIYVLGWAVLIVITFGIAALFFPYSALRRILNGVVIYGDDGVVLGQLQVELSMMEQLGHIALWFIIHAVVIGLGVATMGLGLLALPIVTILYYFGVGRTVVERTSFIKHGSLRMAAGT